MYFLGQVRHQNFVLIDGLLVLIVEFGFLEEVFVDDEGGVFFLAEFSENVGEVEALIVKHEIQDSQVSYQVGSGFNVEFGCTEKVGFHFKIFV